MYQIILGWQHPLWKSTVWEHNLSPTRHFMSKAITILCPWAIHKTKCQLLHYNIKQIQAEDRLLYKYNSSDPNLEEAVGGKWTMSAICLSGRRAGTYMSLQMHMTGRFSTLPLRPFFLPRATLPVYFPSTNFIRTSMDACKAKVTFICINKTTVHRA